MCPVCLTAAVMTAAGSASGAGLLAVVVARWRRLRQWLLCRVVSRAAAPAQGANSPAQ